METVKDERRTAAAAAANGAPRRPLAPSKKNNAAPAGRRPEGHSRFKPVTPPAPSPAAARRCSSPSPGRASAADGGGGSATCSSRARSADRARPAAPSPSPSPAPPSSRLTKPSTAAARSVSAMPLPPRDAAGDGHRHSTPPRARNAKKASSASGDLWASASAAARSSSPLHRPRPEPVPSSPASKVDRLVQGLPCSSEQAKLRPAAGAVAAETKRSPRRASSNNTGGDQCENSRPSVSPANPNSVPCQHRWPAMMMTGRSTTAAALTTSTTAAAPAEKKTSSRTLSSSDSSARKIVVHRRRKNKADSSSDADDTSSQTSEGSKSTSCRRNKAVSSPVPVLRRSSSAAAAARQGLLSAAASSSPSSSRSCCQSPSRMRPSASAPCCQSKCASCAAHSAVEQPVFSFIFDALKGKKSAGQIEKIHQLRLLSSRYLQWRFVNARSEETLSRKTSVESIIYNVWKSILKLRDALTITRTNVRHLQQEVKLYDILTEQTGYLEQWPVLEEECKDTLVEATEALKASTLRLPVTSGAHADEISVRNAISSAVDVMQALSSSIYYVQSKVEDRTSLVSELSVMARQEKIAVDQCRELLATVAKLQVQETSLRTHLMQLRQRSAA